MTDENDATPEAEVDTPIEGEESADDETPAEGDAPTGAEAPADKPPAGMMPR